MLALLEEYTMEAERHNVLGVSSVYLSHVSSIEQE